MSIPRVNPIQIGSNNWFAVDLGGQLSEFDGNGCLYLSLALSENSALFPNLSAIQQRAIALKQELTTGNPDKAAPGALGESSELMRYADLYRVHIRVMFVEPDHNMNYQSTIVYKVREHSFGTYGDRMLIIGTHYEMHFISILYHDPTVHHDESIPVELLDSLGESNTLSKIYEEDLPNCFLLNEDGSPLDIEQQIASLRQFENSILNRRAAQTSF
jgi:hypothetical protein